MIRITLKDGSVKQYDSPVSAADIAKDLSMGLYRIACAARVNGQGVRSEGTHFPRCYSRNFNL